MLFYISSLQYCEGIVAFSRGSLRVRVWPRLPNSPQILVNQSCFEPHLPTRYQNWAYWYLGSQRQHVLHEFLLSLRMESHPYLVQLNIVVASPALS